MSREKWVTIFAFIFGLFFVWFLHGAVPFLGMPTLGQAVWTMGFSQSFINESIFSIHALNIGAPEPAAIAFGLAGAWPAAIFLKLGLHPADAYSSMVALWLTIAFLSAFGIGQYFSVRPMFSLLGAVSWMTMPVIWGHAGYSMVSIGIALLPFYFLIALQTFMPKSRALVLGKFESVTWIFFYLAVCLISIFMDGYSFMMFAVGSTLLIIWFLVFEAESRKRLISFSFPVHCFTLGFAYLSYVLYIGKTQFEASPIDFFRGWGADVSFLLIPTRSVHWFADFIGWSVPRSEDIFFGDASVWLTSFSIPIILGSVWASLYISGKKGIKFGFILVAMVGFYMALGPSLKVYSVKPAGVNVGQMMAAKYAVAPTGSAVFSKNLPGFKNMRASYRWGALGVFGAWALLVLAMSKENKRKNVAIAAVIVSLVVVLNLPNIPQKYKNHVKNRDMFLRLDSELIADMKQVVSPREKIAFLPWRNDFLVNYVASRLDVVTFNIGGDKNLAEARLHWPKTMCQFPMATVDDDFANRLMLLLSQNEVDVVILPFIDMLWAAHRWPYPIELRNQLSQAVAQLVSSGFVDVEAREYYSVVRLKPGFSSLARKGTLEYIIRRTSCMPPVCLKRSGFRLETLKQVGIVQNGRLVSNGKKGFLHFGPYVPMSAGSYTLFILGYGDVSSSSWVDVTSGQGCLQHGKFGLTSNNNESDGRLAEGPIILEAPVNDLEVRIYVGAEDKVTLEGFKLLPVNGGDAPDTGRSQ